MGNVKRSALFFLSRLNVSLYNIFNQRRKAGRDMKLKKLPWALTVCKLDSAEHIDLNADFYFIGRTDEELSLVCRTESTPANTIAREDGWRGFRIEGTLEFSLIGILAPITTILAENKIGIFAVSTYNTDYILVKKENMRRAMEALAAAGYETGNE